MGTSSTARGVPAASTLLEEAVWASLLYNYCHLLKSAFAQCMRRVCAMKQLFRTLDLPKVVWLRGLLDDLKAYLYTPGAVLTENIVERPASECVDSDTSGPVYY